MQTIDNRSFKEKMKDRFNKIKWKVEDAFKWVKANPKESATIVTGGAVIIRTCFRIVKMVINQREARERRKEVYCNDIQSVVKLKHELSYNEARELRDRMNDGQSKFEALDQMNLLKR